MSTISLPTQRSPQQMIPDDISTRVAIRLASEEIAGARRPDRYGYSTRIIAAGTLAERVVAATVLGGGTLAEARGWAMQVALIRDALCTRAERHAWRPEFAGVAS